MAVGFAIADEDGAVLDLDDTRIGDSHSEDVRGKVLEACFAGERCQGRSLVILKTWRDD